MATGPAGGRMKALQLLGKVITVLHTKMDHECPEASRCFDCRLIYEAMGTVQRAAALSEPQAREIEVRDRAIARRDEQAIEAREQFDARGREIERLREALGRIRKMAEFGNDAVAVESVARAAVEQAAPEGGIDSFQKKYHDAMAILSEWGKIDLAAALGERNDAREAIREAAKMFSGHRLCSYECMYKAWLALPAVVAALDAVARERVEAHRTCSVCLVTEFVCPACQDFMPRTEVREREAAVWAAALQVLSTHEDHNGEGNHGRTDGRVSDCLGELEQVFRARAAAGKGEGGGSE